jgi:hypothetical protein
LETEIPVTEPYQDFLFAMNSPVTREMYSTRLRSFFIHIGIEGSIMEERCRRFVEKAKESEEKGNSKWAYASVIKFLQYQKDRCDKRHITGSTVRGYYKAAIQMSKILLQIDIVMGFTGFNRLKFFAIYIYPQ